MIVAVEGPSAAGKTTWCRRNTKNFVGEYVSNGAEPDGADLSAQAEYWTRVNSRRWSEALQLERDQGTAVCDSDPVKLHYSWSLMRIGATSRHRFEYELTSVAEAFVAETLGLPDLVLVSIPSIEQLRSRKDNDSSRSRRSFELHSRLAEPLREWYSTLEQLDPGRIRWHLPPDGQPLPIVEPRRYRSDVQLLKALIAALPTVPDTPN